MKIQKQTNMGFREFKLGIAFAFVLAASLHPDTTVDGLVTDPEGSKFVLLTGRPFEITCNASGRFDRMYWKTPTGITKNNGNVYEQKIADNSLKLAFTNPTYNTSGEYFCLREYVNEPIYFGSRDVVIEKKIEIIFYNPELKFEKPFENVMGEEGASVEVKCSASGDKPITYEWRNQYEEIIPYSYDTHIRTVYVTQSEDASILKIRKLSSNETGSYTCIANNSQGLTKKEYEILMKDSTGGNKDNDMPSIRHVQIVSLTANSIIFGLSASGIASSIRMIYLAKESGIVNEKEWRRGDTYEVKGLSSGETYGFRFKAIPDDSKQVAYDGGWSKEHVVVMLPDKPDVVFHAISGGSVEIGWNREKEYKKVDKYKLMYFPITFDKEKNWIPSSCPISVDIPSCTSYSVKYTISGLRMNTDYELQLQAHTVSGFGETYKQKIYIQ